MTLTTHNVARRYQAAVVIEEQAEPTEIFLSDEGIITTSDLRRLLEPQLGFLVKMRLRPSLSGIPNTISWEALNEEAEVVSGRVELHAAPDTNGIIVWADLFVDDDCSSTLVATTTPRQLLDGRLRRIADRTRGLIRRVRVQPQMPGHGIVCDLVGIVEIAEGE